MKEWLLSLVVALSIAAVLAAQLLHYVPRVSDDLLLGLRYAEHLLEGHGLTFNIGQRVEGYGSVWAVGLQTLGLLAGLPGIWGSKLLTVLGLAGLLASVYAASRDLMEVSAPAALISVLAISANSYIVSWTLASVEMSLLLALVMGFTLVLNRYLEDSDQRTLGAVAMLLGGLLCTTQPEGVVTVLVMICASALHARHAADLRERSQLLLPIVVVIGLLYVGFLAWRWLYFDAAAPPIFALFDRPSLGLEGVLALWTSGASIAEWGLVSVGLCVAVGLALKKPHSPIALGLIVVGLCHMWWAPETAPNQRYAVVVWLGVTLALAWAVDQILRVIWPEGERDRAWWRVVVGVAGSVALVAGSGALGMLDTRDTAPGADGVWRWPKSVNWALAAWRPNEELIASEGDFSRVKRLCTILEMGTEEASEAWYLGDSDIGLIGYFSPIQIERTRGRPLALLLRSTEVSNEGLSNALLREPIAVHWGDAWATAAAESGQWLDTYAVVEGDARRPRGLVHREAAPPTWETILARYARVEGMLPKVFRLASFRGEFVGNALRTRAALLRVELQEPFVAKAPPPRGLKSSAVFGEHVRFHGCIWSAAQVEVGGDVRLGCYFEALSSVAVSYTIVLELVDASGTTRLRVERLPVNGVYPTVRWVPGTLVHDTTTLHIPDGLETGQLQLRVGLREGSGQAVVRDARSVDDEGRVIGPSLDVRAAPAD